MQQTADGEHIEPQCAKSNEGGDNLATVTSFLRSSLYQFCFVRASPSAPDAGRITNSNEKRGVSRVANAFRLFVANVGLLTSYSPDRTCSSDAR